MPEVMAAVAGLPDVMAATADLPALRATLAAEEPLIRWDWLRNHPQDLWVSTQQHALLTAIALVAGLLISAALAAIGRRWRWSIGPITTLTTVLYTIPAVALFAALIPLFGTGLTVPALALTTYSLVVTTPFLISALDELDPAVLDAADGLGLTRLQRLLRVELPLAAPVIVAGLRVTATTIIGLVTVGGLFGLGGYGNLIDNGLSRDFPTLIIAGVLGSVVMALVADLALAGLGAALAPWRRAA